MKRLFVMLFCLAGINSLFAGEQAPVAVTSADSGKTNTVKVGQVIVVSLDGNITTGYAWDMAGIKGDSVAQEGKVEYLQKAHPEGMVGGGGMFQAKFKAKKPGKTIVKLEYARSWEKDQKPARTFEITISVEK